MSAQEAREQWERAKGYRTVHTLPFYLSFRFLQNKQLFHSNMVMWGEESEDQAVKTTQERQALFDNAQKQKAQTAMFTAFFAQV